jgi:aminoglycoside phosphotransferase (APT) family kinase protein
VGKIRQAEQLGLGSAFVSEQFNLKDARPCPESPERSARRSAALHACRWNDDSLHDVDFLIPLSAERARFLGDITLTAPDQFIARLGSRMEGADTSTLRQVAEVLGDWQRRRATPFSLMHGDYRLDNLMFPPIGEDVVAVDWQTLTVALPARDLSYFIGTSLPVEERRAVEHRLVRSYHDELRVRGSRNTASNSVLKTTDSGNCRVP